jgi:uncharacterized membrane protein
MLASFTGETGELHAPTVEQLMDASYHDILSEQVTLHDGVFEGETHMPGAASRDVVKVLAENYAAGDLTGDGIDEAAITAVRDSGGSGLFFYLAVFRNDGGVPENVATIALKDRVRINALEIRDGTLIADLVEHGDDDPMCCPSKITHREWRLRDGDLIQTVVSTMPMKGRFTGYLVWGHEARSFRTCDGDREGWVINEASEEVVEIYESLTSEPYQEMFVEVRGAWESSPADGFGAEYPEALRITALIRAEREGFGCRRKLDEFLYAASGNEPGWNLEIRADGLTMKTMTAPEGVDFSSAEILDEDGRIVVNAGKPGSAIRAILERKRCVDTMSGARYSLAASVEVNGQQFEGCALQGR